jgi:hypothetical protein
MNRPAKNAPYLLFFLLLTSPFLKATDREQNQNVYKEIVETWNTAHNDWRFDELKRLYASKVLYYTKWQTRDFCVSNKFGQVSPKEKFQHKVEGTIKIKALSDNLVLCSFIKTVRRGQALKEYPAYLVLQQIDAAWCIVAESDEITDKNRNFVISASVFNSPRNPKVQPPKSDADDETTGSLILLVISIGIIVIVCMIITKRKTSSKIQEQTSHAIVSSVPVESAPESAPKPTNKEIGTAFEDFIITKFDKNYFSLLERTNDTVVAGVYAQSRSNPDFLYKFVLRKYTKIFAVECTYRSEPANVISVKLAEQLDRYQKFSEERNVDVYIILGMGGLPNNPEELFIIPLKKAQPKMTYDALKVFKRRTLKRFYFERSVEVLT